MTIHHFLTRNDPFVLNQIFFGKTINVSVSVNFELWTVNYESWVIFWSKMAHWPSRDFFRKSNNISTYCLPSLCKIWKSLEWILKKSKICKISLTPNVPPLPPPQITPFEAVHRAPCRAKNTLTSNKYNTTKQN